MDERERQLERLRRAFMDSMGGGVVPLGSFGQVSPQPTFRNEPSETEALRAQLKKYSDVLQALQKEAAPYATVIAMRKDRVVLAVGGRSVEVSRGDMVGLRPGQTVKVHHETLQILELVDDLPPAGEIFPVVRVSSSTMCEIERTGSVRAISYYGTVEEGDRVVVDPTGSVVVANLGKAPNDATFGEATGVTWDDIGGLEEAKRHLREAVEAPTKHGALLARYGKKPIRGVMLSGPPGCGKTMLGKAAATALAEMHGNAAAGAFFYVKGPELLNMYVGNSESNVRNLFVAARRHKKQTGHPAIIFLDEADAILGKRSAGMHGMNTLSATMVPAFLAEMDGLQDSGALVLLATNRPDTLDPAVVRDGRIDRRIKVTRPTRDDARQILSRTLSRAPLAVGLDETAEATVEALYDKALVLYHVKKHSSVGAGVPLTLGHIVSGAMCAGIVDRATSNAMHRELAGGEPNVGVGDVQAAVTQTFREALDVNHADEIAEFCEGWESEICGVSRASRGSVVSEAN